MTDKAIDEMSFEEAMSELDRVVGQLERGDVPLDDSIKLYERGAALKARCEAKLKDAEEKVEQLTLDADGYMLKCKMVCGQAKSQRSTIHSTLAAIVLKARAYATTRIQISVLSTQ